MKIKPYPIEFDDEARGVENLITVKQLVSDQNEPISLKYTCNYSAIADDLFAFLATEAANSVVRLEIVFAENIDDKPADKETVDRIVSLINSVSPTVKALSIEFSWTYDADEYIDSVKTVLKENKTLTELSLNGFTLTKDSVNTFFEHLKSNNESKICAIKLHSCDYKGNALEEFCSLLKSYERITGFEVDSLVSSKIENVDVMFAELLSNNKSLKHFAARDAITTDAQFEQLASALASNNTLQSLDLSTRINEREVLDRSILILASVLQANTSLLHLNLSRLAADFDHAPISRDGMRAFANMLKVNTTLQSLDLFYNHLPADSMRDLMQGLYSNKGLRWLSIEQNAVSDDLVVELMRRNNTLRVIDSDELDHLRAVANVLKDNTSIVSLTLPASSDCGDAKRKELEQIWKCLSDNRARQKAENTPRLAAMSMFSAASVGKLPEENTCDVRPANR